jgi:hypothetical protein
MKSDGARGKKNVARTIGLLNGGSGCVARNAWHGVITCGSGLVAHEQVKWISCAPVSLP